MILFIFLLTVTIQDPTTLNPGVSPFGPFSIPTGYTSAEITYDTTDHTVVSTCWVLAMDISFDGGTTWEALPQAGRCGGTSMGRDGKTPTFSAGMVLLLPQPANAARRVRGTFTLTGGSLTTSGVLTLKP